MADQPRRPMAGVSRRDEAAAPDDLDAALRETFRRIQALDEAPPPDDRFVRRLREDLMSMPVVPGRMTVGWTLPTAGRSARDLMPAAARRRIWPLSQLAAAALIALTLGLGYSAWRPVPGHHAADLPAGAGAPLGTPAPTAAPAQLARLTLPALPFNANVANVSMIRARIAPGGYIHSDDPAGGGSELFYVESGAISAGLLAGNRPVVDLGSGLGPVAATPTPGGVERLVTGDVGWIQDGATIELRNDAATPATLLWLVSNMMTETDRDVVWEDLGPVARGALPTGPVLITLERRALAPNAEFSAPPAPALTVAGLVDPPYGYLAVDPSGSARNRAKTTRDVYVLTIAPATASSPTPTP